MPKTFVARLCEEYCIVLYRKTKGVGTQYLVFAFILHCCYIVIPHGISKYRESMQPQLIGYGVVLACE